MGLEMTSISTVPFLLESDSKQILSKGRFKHFLSNSNSISTTISHFYATSQAI